LKFAELRKTWECA